MVQIHVEAHADGIGRDQIIDIARLVQRNLGVARARAERAHHYRRSAALAADHLGQPIDIVGRERDRGRAARQAAQFFLAAIA